MITLTEYRLLAVLRGNKELTGRDVARAYEDDVGDAISRGTLYTCLSRMASKGWLTHRTSNGADRRVRFFALTSAGIKALADAPRDL